MAKRTYTVEPQLPNHLVILPVGFSLFPPSLLFRLDMICQFPSTISLILGPLSLSVIPFLDSLQMTSQEPTFHPIWTPSKVPLDRTNRGRIQSLPDHIISSTDHLIPQDERGGRLKFGRWIVVDILGLGLEIIFPCMSEFTSLWSITYPSQFPLSTHFRSSISSHWELPILVLFSSLDFASLGISGTVPRVSLSCRSPILGCVVVDCVYVVGSICVG